MPATSEIFTLARVDAPPVFIDTVEELQEAIEQPEAFLQRLGSTASQAGLRLLIPRPRPALTPQLQGYC